MKNPIIAQTLPAVTGLAKLVRSLVPRRETPCEIAKRKLAEAVPTIAHGVVLVSAVLASRITNVRVNKDGEINANFGS